MPGIILPKTTVTPPAPKPYVESNVPVYGKNAAGAKVVTGNKPVSSFTHGGVRVKATNGGEFPVAKKAPAKAPTKAPTKVVLHPDGRVEIVHHSAATAAPAAPASPTSKPIVLPKGGKGGAPGAFGSTTDIMTPQTLANARAAAAAKPGAPLTIEQQARALLNPVEQSTTAAIDARIKAQQDAINSSTQTLAALMGQYAPASKAIYANAQAGQSAIDGALGQTLAGQGQAGQAELAANLAKIDADPATAARLSAAAGANASGASGAFAARGASSLSDLVSRGASAQDYGAKLPGTAGEYGLQATKQAQTQGTTDTASAIAALEAKYPDLVQSLKQNQQQQRANDTTRAVAISQLLGKVTPQASKLLGVGAGTPTAAAAAATAKAAAASAKAAAAKTAATTKANAAAGKVNLPLSKEYKILVNANGDPVLKNGQIVRLPGSTTDGLSVKDFKKYRSQAKAGAILAHNGGTDAKGNQLPPIPWGQYRQHGLAAGIPEEILIAEGKTVYSPAEIKQGLIPGQGPKRGR